MSVSAKFVADFSSFTDAVKKAELDLDKLNSGADKAAGALNRMVADFSGQKLIQQAQVATEAIDRIGGVTKLTQAEQAKLNAQVTEAIAKYDALGKEAPADMVKLQKETQAAADALKKVPAATDSILGGLAKMAGAIGVSFSVGAVISFGKSVLDTAGHIADLSEQMGISTDAVQGFKEAAELSGSSLDTVGTALTKMNEKLSNGDKSTVSALGALGLKFSEIRQLSPEDAFLKITAAIQNVQDPMDQARIAMELFGKSGAELLPAIKNGFGDTAQAASKMSKDTITALDDAGDAWNKFYNRIVNNAGEVAAVSVKDAEKATRSWRDFFEFLGSFTPSGTRRDLPPLPKDINLPVDNKPPPPLVPPKTQEELDAIEKHMQTIRDLQGEIFGGNAQAAARNYTEALGGVANLSKVNSVEQKKINDAIGEALDVYARFGKTAPQAMRDLFIATTQMDPAVAGLVGAFSNVGVKLEQEVIPVTADFAYRLNYIAGIPFGAKIGQQFDLISPKVKVVTADLEDVSQALAHLAQISGTSFGGIVQQFSTLVGSANAAKKSIDLIRDSKSSGSTLTEILNLSAGITGLISSALAAGKALFNLFDRNKGRDVVEDFAKSFGGFDALHDKLLELGADGERLWIKLTQGVGQNNPEQAKQAVDEVTRALDKQATTIANMKPLTLADQASQMGFHTIAELQVMSDQAVKLWEYMRDSGLYSAEAVQSAWEKANDALVASGDAAAIAAKKSRDEIKKLDSEYQSLADSIAGEAPEEFMGSVEKAARDRMAAIDAERKKIEESINASAKESSDKAQDVLGDTSTAIDDLQTNLGTSKDDWADWASYVKGQVEIVAGSIRSLSIPSPGGSLPFSAGGGTTFRADLNTSVNLDGKQIAENTAYHLLN